MVKSDSWKWYLLVSMVVGVPQNGWFPMEHPNLKWMMTGGTPISGTTSYLRISPWKTMQNHISKILKAGISADLFQNFQNKIHIPRLSQMIPAYPSNQTWPLSQITPANPSPWWRHLKRSSGIRWGVIGLAEPPKRWSNGRIPNRMQRRSRGSFLQPLVS